eukprot:scaffold88114_cov64-Phaeocystis_antarctica.AAC.3
MLYVGHTHNMSGEKSPLVPLREKLGLALALEGPWQSARARLICTRSFGQMICLLVLVPSLQAPSPQRRVFVQTATNMLPPEAPATFRAWPALNDEVRHPEPISDPGPGPDPPTSH